MMVRYAANSDSGGYSPTTSTEYIALLASRLSSAFDMVPQWLGVEYDVAAVFRERVEQTALLRDNVMDWSDTTEVVLLSVADGAPDVQAALEGLRDITIASSEPSRHHRLTTVVRVLVMGGSRVASPLTGVRNDGKGASPVIASGLPKTDCAKQPQGR